MQVLIFRCTINKQGETVITSIKITKKAEKDLNKTPKHIREKFTFWVRSVNRIGLLETRKCSGWHDEPLYKDKNRDKGQRSIRLINNGARSIS